MKAKQKAILRSVFGAMILTLASSCSSLFYYPSRSLYYPPQKFGYQGQQLELHARDGTELYAWYFPVRSGTKPKGTIIQFHGNAENMSSHYLALIWLVEKGYELVTFDYRGYGKSAGEPSQKGTYLDGLAALDLAWDLHVKSGAPKFIVIGQSLGGAIAMRSLADFPEKNRVNLLVLDSTFTSYKTVARRKLSSWWLTWPLSPLGNVLVSDEYSAEDSLKNNHVPVLIIHDEEDPVMPFSCAEDSLSLANDPKAIWVLHNGTHIGAFSDPRSPTREKFVNYLNQLSGPEAK